MKKYIIKVKKEDGQIVKTIQRKLYGKQIGNFNPFFCRFGGKTFQVHSEEGDLSDPFRREDGYAKSFFIQLEKPCQWSL